MQLYPFQKKGVKFCLERPVELNRKPHRLLADEMGLGKTVQAIVALKMAKAKRILIICPASVKYNWVRQIINWGLADESKIDTVTGFSHCYNHLASIFVVNYDLLRSDANVAFFLGTKWDALILDEAHRLKHFSSKRANIVLGGGKKSIAYWCFRKILLTGTPMQNRPLELYFILKTLAPECLVPFDSYEAYGRYFCNGYYDGNRKTGPSDPSNGWNFKGAKNLEELRDRLKPFMLRREIRDVYRELPEVVEEVVYLPCDVMQHPEVIEQLKDDSVARTEEFDPIDEMPLATARRIVAECKIPAVFEYLCDMLESVEKVLVFAYHRSVVEGILELCADYSPVALYGGISAKRKQELLDEFISNPECRISIVQINSGGEGTDGFQQVCNHAVFAELDWSAGAMRQAVARLHRIGQKETVFARFLVADQTIERIIGAQLEKKNRNIDILMKGNDTVAIEQLLSDLIEAVNKNTAALLGGKSTTSAKPAKAEVVDDLDEEEEPAKPAKAAAKSSKKAPAKKEKTYTEDDVRDAATEFIDAGGDDEVKKRRKIAREIVAKLGHEKIQDIPESQYAKAIQAFEAKKKEMEPEAESEIDDGGDEDDDLI